MPFGKRRSSAYINPEAEQDYAGIDYPDEEVNDWLSDIFRVVEAIEKNHQELVNQGDKQIEFLSRLVTLFEGAAREAKEARKNVNPE